MSVSVILPTLNAAGEIAALLAALMDQTQPPEEILNHTYEYTMREDIVMCMEELELSPKQAKALLRSLCPLDDVYKEFKDREVEHMDTIRDSIETRANDVLKRDKNRESR